MKKARRNAARMLAGLLAACAAVGYADDAGVVPSDSQTDRVPLHTVIPDYPKIARRDRIEGEVQVCFDITRDGRPRRIAVRRSTNRVFEKPAMKAVRRSTFVPLRPEEALPAIKACRTFRFSLVPVSPDEPG